MSVRRRCLALAALALALVLTGARYGESIIPRLSDHRGFQLIAVDDRVGDAAATAFAPVRPRRVYLVLVDGLRADVAATLPAWQALAAAGVCRRTWVSLPTVSRPVYAMVSTGLEQDRTGARNNDDTSPLAAESVWQVARAAGRRVVAFSSLPWWRELFPGGFDRYVLGKLDDDFFVDAGRADEDLVLVHPVFVDESGHQHGAASRAYHAAAARADAQLHELLARVDLAQDVVVVTADHGHSATGGHGGDAPEVATTLTCFAGRNLHAVGLVPGVTMNERSIGPLVAVLAGLRFPRHMRPGLGDGLWADLAGLPAAYLADRRAAEARFAAASAGLDGLYARGRRVQLERGAAVALVLVLAFALLAWRRLGLRGAVQLGAWIVLVVAANVAVYTLVRGSFDTTSINQRAEWVRASIAVGLGVGALGMLAHALVFRSAGPRRIADQLTLASVGVGATVVHIAAFGWVLGFPLPHALGFFLPFFIAAFVSAHALVALALAGFHAARGA